MHLLSVLWLFFSKFSQVSSATSTDAVYPSKRSLIIIIRSCFSTIFICAWVSVHPNIPPTNQGQASALWRRLKLMFWAIIAPELILAWAVRQWLAARRIRDTFNQVRTFDQPWTMEHGHFLVMGGYVLINPPNTTSGSHSTVLFLELFEELVHNPNFDFPSFSIAEIRDKSKSDFLAKFIAIVQTTWFIVECIVRATQRLTITELELVTLALASLNAITFFFWWHKPLGVQEPVKIYLNDSILLSTSSVMGDVVRDSGVAKEPEIIDITVGEVSLAIRELLVKIKLATFWCSTNIASEVRKSQAGFLIRKLLFFPIGLYFFLTFPFYAISPMALTFVLWIFKVDPPPLGYASNVFGYQFPHIFALMDLFRLSAPYVIKKAVARSMFTECLNVMQQPGDSVVPALLIWFIALPVLSFFSALVFLVYIPISLTIIGGIYVVFSSVFELLATTTVKPSATHVPAFYAPNTQGDNYSRIIVFAFFGITFGGIHCIAWNFIYPTRFEQVFWRVTSLIITSIPVIAAPLTILLSNAQQNRRTIAEIPYKPEEENLSDFVFINRSNASGFLSFSSQKKLVRREWTLMMGDICLTALLFTYVPARIALIGQALALLRAQPINAFLDIDWVKLIPHV